MNDPKDYKPFYHPVYGWQWLDMNQTYEQETHARLKCQGDRQPGCKSSKVIKSKHPEPNRDSRERDSSGRGSTNKE